MKLMDLLKKNAHSIYFFGLILMAVALPLSKFLNGLSMFVIIGAWIVGGNYIEKIKRFASNPIALLWCSVYLLHLLGLFYTTDFNYAINDLRIKVPLFVFPLIISSSQPLTKAQLYVLLKVFIAAALLSSFVSMSVYWGFIHRTTADARTISILISHIRLALLICLSVFFLLYFISQESLKPLSKIIYSLAAVWLIVFLFILESFTGILILVALVLITLSYQLFRKKQWRVKLIYLSIIFVLAIGIVNYLKQNYLAVTQAKPIDLTQLDSLTSLGNPYLHIKEDKAMENGNYVFLYLCTRELDSVWTLRSKLSIKGLDLKGQPMRVTLFRFLTSKNLRKDASGVASLTPAEIKAVENGITNIDFQNYSSSSARLRQIFWEINTYFQTGNPSGHSVTMRIEYLKTGLQIVKDHPLIGVGTGDVNNAFLEKYEVLKSPIAKIWRLRAHNQYLTFAVSFGCIGLAWFVFSLLYPLWKYRKNLSYFYLVFLCIALLSMLNEDTLETQAGLTFYAFFNSLLWFNTIATNKDQI
jgi:O-Antigen ligase